MSRQANAPLTYDYTPHPRQAYAHTVMVDELLYGGAAGGGKSRWARAALVQLALQVPGSRSVLFRRTFPDMIRSVEQPFTIEVPVEMAKYNRSRHEFTFHNGSVIELAHLQRAHDVEKYQGAEYQLIVFEEATHFTFDQYIYLKSRLRASGPVAERLKALGWAPRMLLTANPGGIGHHWVKARFVDPAPPETVFQPAPTLEDPRPGTRCYIPARAVDNPSLNPEYLDQLNALPEDLRKALRDGDWNVLEGVRFSSWSEKHHVIDPADLPIPALTGRKVIAVDYGYAAPFAAVWLCLLHDGLVVQYREEYATELTATQQAQRIKELSAPEEAVTGEKIPVVMDPAMWRRNDATTRKPLSRDLPPVGSPAHDYMKVLDRVPIKAVNHRVHGWGLLDEKLRVQKDGFARFMVYNTCRDTIRTLPALPRDKKNPEDVDTDAEDHLCFIGDTLIATATGMKPIQDIQVGEMVWTRAGLRKVTDAAMTARNTPVGRVEFSNGAFLEGTGNHPVIARHGVVPLDALRYGDTVQLWNQNQYPLSSTASPSGATPTLNVPQIDGTTGPRQHTYAVESERSTKKSGSTTTNETSPRATTSTTSIMTGITTTLPTSPSSKGQNTCHCICALPNAESNPGDISTQSDTKPQNGTAAQRVVNGIASTASEHGSDGSASITLAASAVKPIRRSGGQETCSAPMHASQDGGAQAASMMCSDCAKAAVRNSLATSTTRPGPAHAHVVSAFVSNGTADVYNLTVEGEHEYFANGILVHNCDSIRYGLQYLAGKKAGQQAASGAAVLRPLTGGLGSRDF